MDKNEINKAQTYLNDTAHLAHNISSIARDMSPEVWAVVNADLADARTKLEDIECMFNPDGMEID